MISSFTACGGALFFRDEQERRTFEEGKLSGWRRNIDVSSAYIIKKAHPFLSIRSAALRNGDRVWKIADNCKGITIHAEHCCPESPEKRNRV
jgi:hypothetical protein